MSRPVSSKTYTLAVNQHVEKWWGFSQAWCRYRFNVYGEVLSIRVYAKVHPTPCTVIGAPSRCDVYVGINNEYAWDVKLGRTPPPSGYEMYEVRTDVPAPVPFFVLQKWSSASYCGRYEATTSDFRDLLREENWIIVLFDVAEWGWGSGGTIELLQVTITFYSDSPPNVVADVVEASAFYLSDLMVLMANMMLITMMMLFPIVLMSQFIE
ncbi:MAG: hypothetical protein QXQ20_09060 [Candidatus Nezhaarchaeales archaeon]